MNNRFDFTPGPYMISRDVNKAIVSIHNPRENLLGLDKEGYAIVMKQADAELFAAAPEMLMALIDLIKEKISKITISSEYVDELRKSDKEIDRCLTIIERATGKKME